MLDQDTARALLPVADESGARVALVGDRHQLPAVGRGGVLDHAVAWAHPTAVVTLEKVRRFTDPAYAALSLRMRNGDDPGGVFDALHHRGQVVIHASEAERSAVLAAAGAAGDRVATRRNDPGLQVANRQTWTVTGIRQDGSLLLRGRGWDGEIPADYAAPPCTAPRATLTGAPTSPSATRPERRRHTSP